MLVDYIAGNATDGLTLKLYRGEDMVLIAFDIDDSLKKPDFVGRYPVFPRRFHAAARCFQLPDVQARTPEGKERRETYPARRPRQHAFTHPAVPLGARAERSA